MKLNLVPVTVSRGAKSRSAWVIFVLLILIGAGAMAAMIIISSKADLDAKQQVADARPKADEAYNYSTQGDAIMLKAANELRNANLANAMLAHDTVYPDTYEDLFKYNPPFFRLISIQATPIDEKTCTVTMQGTLTTYQQYADLMLALMRNPKVISVARSGYNWDQDEVPPLTSEDQVGKPRKPGAAPIPDDPLERLTYFETTSTPPAGFTGQGNFGTPDTTKEAMPGESLITVSMVAMYALQTPNPRATLAAAVATAAPGAATGPAPTAPTTPTQLPTPSTGAGRPAGGAGVGKGKDDE